MSKAKKISIFNVFMLLMGYCYAQHPSADVLLSKQKTPAFIENKGQMTDVNGNTVPDVLFKTSLQGLDIYITEKGLTYVFVQGNESKTNNDMKDGGNFVTEMAAEDNKTFAMAQFHMRLVKAKINKNNIVKQGESREHFNFFYHHCPNGIYDVRLYEKLTVKDVYPGIDWVLYTTGMKGVKYDFIVNPGADPSAIRMLYESEEPLSIDNGGNIHVTTPLGILTENAPYTYYRASSVPIESHFRSKQISKHNVEVSFQLGGLQKITSFDSNTETIVIDPQLTWCTLYAGNGWDGIRSLDVDAAGNLFAALYTYSTGIPVPGAFQAVNGGNYDAGILKFDNNGVLLWGTYYGGSNNDFGVSIRIDSNQDVYLTGGTNSANFPVFDAGTYFDNSIGGVSDCFILKFSNTGGRLWATYYGGSGVDEGRCIKSDALNNIYIAGKTTSADISVQNSGTFFDGTLNGASDAFLLKFNNVGTRLWATYYGGSAVEEGNALTINSNNDLYVTGNTTSPDFPIQTNGAAYSDGSYGGGTAPTAFFPIETGDIFILKFDNAGNRLWSTFYGGSKGESGMGIASDIFGNIFISGITYSTDFPLLNSGNYFDNLIGGLRDGFILKFDLNGIRQWATYFGGNNEDTQTNDYDRIETDLCGNVYISFNTRTSYNSPPSGIDVYNPSCGSYFKGTQTYAGLSISDDIVITKFTNQGKLLWCSYFGGNGDNDFRGALAIDNKSNIFLAGEFPHYGSATYNISTLPLINPGGGVFFQNLPGAGLDDDAFIAKFIPVVPVITKSQANNTTCTPCSGSATINLTCSEPNYNYTWSNGSTTLNSTNTTNTISGLCPGSYTVTVASSCNQIQTATFVITGTICGGITANVNSASICSGVTPCPTLTATGAGGTAPYTYLWSTAATTAGINPCPASTTNYTVTITDNAGLTATSVAVVTVNPMVSVTVIPTNISCSGTSTGSATASPGGGSTPYVYVWSNGVSGSTVSGLVSGIYTVTVTDSKGCVATSTAGIISPPTLTGQVSKGTANCAGCGCKEWILINATGGTSPYSYTWPDGYINRYKNQLCPGNYIINIKDKNGCSVNVSLSAP
ncbi:MAG: SBBP repeat-containing protein [Bacteroidetes bacterium]|nr:SBBP repeat-containing protein [Bacteroidota bacterium]